MARTILRRTIVVTLVTVLAVPTLASAQFDRTVFAELFSFLSEPFSPDARQALAQLESVYAPEFLWVDWHLIQALSNPDALARSNYYGGISAAPTVFFDGTDPVVGAGSLIYEIYEEVFFAHQGTAPVVVTSTVSFSEASRTGSIQVDVIGTPPGPLQLRAVIFEDDVLAPGPAQSIFDHIVRAMVIDEPWTGAPVTAFFSLDDPGADPPWGPAANFGAIAWVQNDASQLIPNATRAVVHDPVSVQASSWGAVKSLYR